MANNSTNTIKTNNLLLTHVIEDKNKKYHKIIYDVGNRGIVLWQAQACGGVNPHNVIP